MHLLLQKNREESFKSTTAKKKHPSNVTAVIFFLLNKILIRKRHSLCSLVLTKSKFCDFLHQLFTHVVEKLLIRIISFHSYSIICICNSFCYDHFKYKHRICIILSCYLAEKCENICCLTGYVNPPLFKMYCLLLNS